MYLESRKLVERASRWLLRHRERPLAVGATVEFFAAPFAQLAVDAARVRARRRTRAARQPRPRSYAARGVPAELAARIAALDLLPDALDITELAAAHGDRASSASPTIYAIIGDRLRLDWLRDRIVELPRADRWDALARNALREDVAARAPRDRRGRPPRGRTRRRRRGRVRRAGATGRQTAVDRTLAILDDIATQGVFDLATLSVALRELRALA